MGDILFNIYAEILTLFNNPTISNSWLLFYETAFSFSKDTFHYHYSTNYTFIFTLKLAVCLVFLSAIRGGVPRYRYDFLTKIGWVKFLGLVLTTFLSVFTLVLIW